ncbi:hypothetical protein [Pedobacter sp.]|uniref:hypothetical protein n=1 Tax=Pedobacter sp. TaxID=1411316 RepID=UPI0031DCACA5
MREVITFVDFMLALRNSVLSAAASLNEKNQKLLGRYFETDGQTPKSISIAGTATGEMNVPILAIAPLTTLGIQSASFNITLPVFAKDDGLWVSLNSNTHQTDDEIQLKEIQTSLCVNPYEQPDDFLEKIKGMERGFLTETW